MIIRGEDGEDGNLGNCAEGPMLYGNVDHEQKAFLEQMFYEQIF